jgi:hypothetical protein
MIIDARIRRNVIEEVSKLRARHKRFLVAVHALVARLWPWKSFCGKAFGLPAGRSAAPKFTLRAVTRLWSQFSDMNDSYRAATTAAVAPHLPDQLLLPLAISGGGAFTTSTATNHLKANAIVIEKFLGRPIVVSAVDGIFRVVVG